MIVRVKKFAINRQRSCDEPMRQVEPAHQAMLTAQSNNRRRAKLERPSAEALSEMKPGCSQFFVWLDQLDSKRTSSGVTITYRVVRASKRRSLHVMFRSGSRVLANLWPGTMRLTLADRSSRRASSFDEALAIATRAAGPAADWCSEVEEQINRALTEE